MTNPPPPPAVPGPPEPDQPHTLAEMMPAAKRRPRWPWIVGAAGAVLILSLIGAVLIIGTRGATPVTATPSPSTSSCPLYGVDGAGQVVCKGAPVPVVDPGPTYATPQPSDFRVSVKILKRECFGSAGCNVTYRIGPAYSGGDLDPSVTWLVTYEVHGVEDGPIINTFEVTGESVRYESEESASTTSRSAKLTVKVTEVMED